MKLKFWDLYFDGRWVGMVLGYDAAAAIKYARLHFPDINNAIQMRVKFYGNL